MEKFFIECRRVVNLAINLLLICLAYVFAFYVRFEFTMPGQYVELIANTIVPLILIKVIVFNFFGLFSGLWRYVSIDDLWQILKANLTASFLFIVFMFFVTRLIGFPRSVFILDWVFCVGGIAGVRIITRAFREIFKPMRQKKTKKVLIIGAGETGNLVVRELNKSQNYEVIGFIDDDVSKKNMKLHGKKIFGGIDEIACVVDKYGVESIVTAMPSVSGEVMRKIISLCQFPGVEIKTVPDYNKILSGEVETTLRAVEPEDLLGRETVQVNEREIQKYVQGKRVLITGAAGSIGSEIARQIIRYYPEELILVDYNENDLYFLEREFESNNTRINPTAITADIKEYDVLKHVFSKYKPEVVFHAAAFKHVPSMEKNPSAAVKNNVICTRNLIYASEHYGVERFILISSDKAVNPTNIMGATKRITEMIMQAKSKKSRTKFIAVRFGNVLGSKGSVIPLFIKQIRENRRVTVTHPDVKRFFMSIKEAVQLVLQASAIGEGGEIFILDMGEQIKIMDLAKDVIVLSGLEVDKDVKIDVIGLRPGEKLYEEPLHDGEKDQATKHDKIFIAQPDDFKMDKLMKQVKELERAAILMNSAKIIEKIEEIVPTYCPQGKRRNDFC